MASACAFAQQDVEITRKVGPVPGQVTVRFADFAGPGGAAVQGAPYFATIINESVQTLADGTRIVEKSKGTVARDSQGRTRRDMTLPPIGNLSAADAPHIVIIQDPVAQASYTLNLTDKTAQKMPTPPLLPSEPGAAASGAGNAIFVQPNVAAMVDKLAGGPDVPLLPPPMIDKVFVTNGQAGVCDGECQALRQATTEDLGSKTMEGVFVTGVRTSRTIPAGQIGNEKPITIVTEVWTSPDLNTIVHSKRTDPRMGEQTFELTNINRNDPDPSLFTVPADFKLVEGPKPVIYRSNQ
jgi:hypothetical protein